ncbi:MULTISPECIES: transcriptional antiterminator [unclassified Streptomyces]|uniref:transcriptional antiterminator n=1 Tax=unclassified Streptomyces TaxID=2593676 RepID=UPI00380FDFC7
MDDRLALRIRLFHETGRVRPEVAAFVTAELDALAAEGRAVTEDTAALLTGHLLMALTRLLDGTPVAPSDTDGRIAAELAGHPGALARARAVSARAERELGAPLPDAEINFLGLHLAVLARDFPF